MYDTNAIPEEASGFGWGHHTRHYARQALSGRSGNPLHSFKFGNLLGEGDLEKVLAAAKENEQAGIQTGRDRRKEPRNEPCFVYNPVVNGKAGFHKLDTRKTRRSSQGWTNEELHKQLAGVPETRVFPGFDYGAFAAKKDPHQGK